MQFIAICENQPEEICILTQMLEETLSGFFPDYRIVSYSSGNEFIEALRQKQPLPSLLFLDIYLKDTTGIKIARYIRDHNLDIQIIFLTSSREFIMESYDLNVLYYIVKPLTSQSLQNALSKAADYFQRNQQNLNVQIGHTAVQIPQASILFVETFGNRTSIHTAKDVIQVYLPLRKISEGLSDDNFLMLQRGILVNMAYIRDIQGNLCTLKNGKSYQLSRKNRTALREKYFDYRFQNQVPTVDK